jgi:hypothetical protein
MKKPAQSKGLGGFLAEKYLFFYYFRSFGSKQTIVTLPPADDTR